MPITGQFPSETYLDGLQNDPESSIAVVYNEFRTPILRAFLSMGVTEKDAVFFFQAAVVDAACMARRSEIPASVLFPDFLQALATAHLFASKGVAELPLEVPPGVSSGWTDMPAPAVLRETQANAKAWACLPDLDPACRSALIMEPEEAGADVEWLKKRESCKEYILQALTAKNTSPYAELPEWVLTALRDVDGHMIWNRMQTLEQGWRTDKPPVPPESNRIWRWVVAVFFVTVVGYSVYQFYLRPKTAAEVYADNFAPPGSLIADLQKRYGAEMGNDSVTAHPSMCMMLLREADAYYQASDYKSAMDPLLLIITDSSSLCQSDAWFFLGIIELQMEEPTTAVQCFAKIEDIDRYGEDLYWYQALAFVQMAKGSPLLRDRAIRAVEQAIGNMRDEKRRVRMETMLKNLSK
ncbi:MAG: hypothetical protein ACKVU2_04855 [Saprospiraceae bacterium]